MKHIQLFIALLVCVLAAHGQEKFLTKTGNASFFSDGIIEDIKADNSRVLSIIDTKDGSIAIAILMKSFMFEKSLMQEHFNENYVESDTYPKATFKGVIKDFETLSTTPKDVTVAGDITIHGVTKTVEIRAKITKTDDHIALTGNFPIKLVDFNIKIPTIVIKNIAETVAVNFDLDHKPYTK